MLQVVVSSLTVIAIVVGIINYKLLPNYLKWLLFFVVLKAAGEIGGTILVKMGKPNVWYYNTYTVLSYFFLVPIFYLTFNKPVLRISAGLSAIAYLTYSLVNLFYIEGLNNFNSYTMTLESLLVMTLALCYLFQVFADRNILEIEKDPMFLAASGLLLYFAANLFLFMFSRHIGTDTLPFIYDYWLIIISINNSLFNLILISALWTGRKRPQLIVAR